MGVWDGIELLKTLLVVFCSGRWRKLALDIAHHFIAHLF